MALHAFWFILLLILGGAVLEWTQKLLDWAAYI